MTGVRRYVKQGTERKTVRTREHCESLEGNTGTITPLGGLCVIIPKQTIISATQPPNISLYLSNNFRKYEITTFL